MSRDAFLLSRPGQSVHGIAEALIGLARASCTIDSDGLFVEFDEGSWMRITRADDILRNFEPAELAVIAAVVGADASLHWIEFKRIEDLRDVLRRIADRPDVVINNDHDLTEAGDAFLKHWIEDPGWDWITTRGR